MTRPELGGRVGRLAALACGVMAVGMATPTLALAHGGMPVRLVADQRAGPYAVSVWATPGVGMGMLYVVYTPYRRRDGVAFVAPAAVHVGVAPASGRRAEVLYGAHLEAVRTRGASPSARFVAHVAFDRGEAWRVRVVTETPAAVGDVRAQLDVTSDAMLGPAGLLLYAVPFVLVGGLWGRAAVARRRAAGPRPALTPA